jgi:hypothetical protein
MDVFPLELFSHEIYILETNAQEIMSKWFHSDCFKADTVPDHCRKTNCGMPSK